MEFVSVVVALLTYLIRPQDWVAGLSGKNIVTPIMAWALVAMLIRSRGFSPRSLLQTPIDFAMFAYVGYIIFVSNDLYGTAKELFPYISFYVVTAQALSNSRRIHSFMVWWLIGIVTVAGMAVASEYGLDLTGAHAKTHAFPNQPRLVLNTYLFNNPNALGHTIVLAIPMAFFLLLWRQGGKKKLAGVFSVALAVYCVYLTVSKGAYIVGFGLIFVSLMLGRGRLIQVVLIAIALTGGLAGLKSLPRMNEIGGGKSGRGNEAILGRLLAWEQARAASKEHPTGEGFHKFMAFIRFEGEEILKATHSSYVLVGAELGRYGMFFFVAVLYCCLRFSLFARCTSLRDEQSRRAIALVVMGYVLSGWMIDRSYHLEYFFMAGAACALQRKLGIESGVYEPIDVDPEEWDKLPFEEDEEESEQAYLGSPSQSRDSSEQYEPYYDDADAYRPSWAYVDEGEEDTYGVRIWRRIGPLDLALIAGATWLVFFVWDYIMLNF